MHAERPAACGDVGEDPTELGVLLQKCRELIDHDHEPGHLDSTDIASPGSSDDRFAPTQLSTETGHSAPRTVVVEVGDDCCHMRQHPQRLEGRAALEIGEDE